MIRNRAVILHHKFGLYKDKSLNIPHFPILALQGFFASWANMKAYLRTLTPLVISVSSSSEANKFEKCNDLNLHFVCCLMKAFNNYFKC